MMNVPKWLEPIGFFSFAPACAGRFGADADRRIIQNCPHGRGASAPNHLFGSGSAGLGAGRMTTGHAFAAASPSEEIAQRLAQAQQDGKVYGLHSLLGRAGRSSACPAAAVAGPKHCAVRNRCRPTIRWDQNPSAAIARGVPERVLLPHCSHTLLFFGGCRRCCLVPVLLNSRCSDHGANVDVVPTPSCCLTASTSPSTQISVIWQPSVVKSLRRSIRYRCRSRAYRRRGLDECHESA